MELTTHRFHSAEVRAGGRGHFRVRPPFASFRGLHIKIRPDVGRYFDVVAISVGGKLQELDATTGKPTRIPAEVFAGRDVVDLELDTCSPSQEIEIIVENKTDAPHVFGAEIEGVELSS